MSKSDCLKIVSSHLDVNNGTTNGSLLKDKESKESVIINLKKTFLLDSKEEVNTKIS